MRRWLWRHADLVAIGIVWLLVAVAGGILWFVVP